MRVLQANMHRSKTADALLDQIMAEKDADVAIISEQYSASKNGFWLEDITKTAVIWIPQHKSLAVKSKGTGNGFAWIETKNATLFSCYLTPSDRIEDFLGKLNCIEDKAVDLADKPLIIGGDFNSKATEWGSVSTNSRGRYVLDMMARLGLNIANFGSTPTFRRPGCEGTIPDITLVSERISHKILNWKVLEEFTGSDHNYITFCVGEPSLAHSPNRKRKTIGTRKWNLSKLIPDVFLHHIEHAVNLENGSPDARTLVHNTMQIIQEACNASMRKTGSKLQRKSVYWWTEEIARLRQVCLQCRRKYTRARRTGDAAEESDAFKKAKKDLKNAIKTSKNKKWEELRNDLNNNPWGLGYKIVMKKLGAQIPTPELPEHVMENIVHSLFPIHDEREDSTRPICEESVPQFTEEELVAAASLLKIQKAPGPDGIPAEILKIIADKHPKILLNMYNACLKEGVFPEVWKRQRLVLISKGKGDPESPSAYRPLCMLDTAGKLLEGLLKPRIRQAIDISGGLSKRQHGFRPKMSTIGAIQDVIDGVISGQTGNHYSRRVILLATLDIRNAFNSARWIDMIYALEVQFKCPAYIMNMVKSYLKDRKLMYSSAGNPRIMEITSGAAQGSILGPELWNISYDEILRMDMPPETYLVGYADDIAAVIPARTIEEVERKLNQVMMRTKTWLDSRGLKLATEKTELLIITKKHIPLNVEMQVLTEKIITQNSVKYLGLRLDSRLNFNAQLKDAATKASKIAASLSRLMANIGGPSQSKRRIMMATVQSVLTYGCEIWADSLRAECRRKILAKVQRTAALRVSSAYRTVSEAAILVIGKILPIDLLVKERRKIWELRRNDQETNHEYIRMQTLQQWQNRWSNERHGRWTARLIPDIVTWMKNDKGETNYYLTQLLSGHGYFQKYLHKMGKSQSPHCIYGDGCMDDAEHTFFKCPRWENERWSLERKLNVNYVTAESITQLMSISTENWNSVTSFTGGVLRMKKRDLDMGQYMRG